MKISINTLKEYIQAAEEEFGRNPQIHTMVFPVFDIYGDGSQLENLSIIRKEWLR